jgi:hypothetical protein
MHHLWPSEYCTCAQLRSGNKIAAQRRQSGVETALEVTAAAAPRIV